MLRACTLIALNLESWVNKLIIHLDCFPLERMLIELSWNDITVFQLLSTFPTLHYIYMYAFSRRFYPKRLTVHSGYTFCVSMCVLWESNPRPLALLTQCSNTEPQEHVHLVAKGYSYILVFMHRFPSIHVWISFDGTRVASVSLCKFGFCGPLNNSK